MPATETVERRPARRWIARRGDIALVLFLALSLIFEVVFLTAFQTLGLTDQNAWTSTLFVPGTNWSFTVTVSPLLHLLPISVVIVLLASWTHLARSTAFLPQHETAKRMPSPRRAQETGRFKSARRFFRNLNRRLQRAGRTVKSGFAKIPGVSPISQRLSSARTAVRSTIVILMTFISITVGLVFIAYPDLIYNLTVNLYRGSPALVNLASGIGSWLRGVGTLLPPLGDFGASINNTLIAAAPGFRQSLETAGTSLTKPIFQLDVVGKFALSQNLAAWTAAIFALLYRAYASTRRRRVKAR